MDILLNAPYYSSITLCDTIPDLFKLAHNNQFLKVIKRSQLIMQEMTEKHSIDMNREYVHKAMMYLSYVIVFAKKHDSLHSKYMMWDLYHHLKHCAS